MVNLMSFILNYLQVNILCFPKLIVMLYVSLLSFIELGYANILILLIILAIMSECEAIFSEYFKAFLIESFLRLVVVFFF